METKIQEREKIETLEEIATAYAILDAQVKSMKKQQEELKKQICKELDSKHGHVDATVETRDGRMIQRILAVRQNVDESKLEKLLTADLWDKVTIPKVSMELLMSAIKVDLIKPYQIADALTSDESERLVVRGKK